MDNFEQGSGETVDDLIALAQEVRENAYAPYSRPDNPRKDGAVLVMENGNAYVGVNVETVNFTNATGALTNAAAAAVYNEDDLNLHRAVVATDAIDRYTFSGVNAQVLSEFLDGDEPITVATDDGAGTYRVQDVANPFVYPDTLNGARDLSLDEFNVPTTYHEAVDDEQLQGLALAAQPETYAHISNYHVGVAVRMTDGTTFVNGNMENEDISVTLHGEDTARQALPYGYSPGDFDAVAIASTGDDPGRPCGLCRQTLHEFADQLLPDVEDDLDLFLVTETALDTFTLDELYDSEDGFGPGKLLD